MVVESSVVEYADEEENRSTIGAVSAWTGSVSGNQSKTVPPVKAAWSLFLIGNSAIVVGVVIRLVRSL